MLTTSRSSCWTTAATPSTAVGPIEVFHSAGRLWNTLAGTPEEPRFRVLCLGGRTARDQHRRPGADALHVDQGRQAAEGNPLRILSAVPTKDAPRGWRYVRAIQRPIPLGEDKRSVLPNLACAQHRPASPSSLQWRAEGSRRPARPAEGAPPVTTCGAVGRAPAPAG